MQVARPSNLTLKCHLGMLLILVGIVHCPDSKGQHHEQSTEAAAARHDYSHALVLALSHVCRTALDDVSDHEVKRHTTSSLSSSVSVRAKSATKQRKPASPSEPKPRPDRSARRNATATLDYW